MACRSNPKKTGGQPGKTVSPRSKVLDNFIASGGTFKTIKAGELFRVMSNPQLDKENFTFSSKSKYPYFTRTVTNNGLLGYVDFLDDSHLIRGNSIAVGMMGMQFFYQEHDFYAGQFTKTIYPKFESFNQRIALWFITWFNKNRPTLLGGLVRDFERLFNDIDIELPYIGGNIAFAFIESRIRELEESRIRELEAYLIASGFSDCVLTQSESTALYAYARKEINMASFPIEQLYDKVKLKNESFDKRRDTAQAPSEQFSVPLVNAKHGNNGIMFYGRPEIFPTVEMSIDIVQNGAIATGDVYPQPQATGVLWDAYLIKATTHKDTENSLLYMACTIQKTIKLKFNYDKKAVWNRVKYQSISLPVNADGEIDFDMIETLISAIKKRTILSLKDYIARERQAYNEVTQ